MSDSLFKAHLDTSVAKYYVRVVKYMNEDSMTVVRWLVGVKDGFQVKVGLHQ